MSELLKKAFEAAAREMPEYEQDEFAQWLLDAIKEDDRRWDVAFAESSDKLARLADEALAESAAGRATLLDIEKL